MLYLTQRSSGIWYFRYQIPQQYRSAFSGKTEFKKSLKTCCKNIAKLRASKLQQFVWEKVSLFNDPEFDSYHQCQLFPAKSSVENVILGFVTYKKLAIQRKMYDCLEQLVLFPSNQRSQMQRMALQSTNEGSSIELIESLWDRSKTPQDVSSDYIKSYGFSFIWHSSLSYYKDELNNIALIYATYMMQFKKHLDMVDIEAAWTVFLQLGSFEWVDYSEKALDSVYFQQVYTDWSGKIDNLASEYGERQQERSFGESLDSDYIRGINREAKTHDLTKSMHHFIKSPDGSDIQPVKQHEMPVSASGKIVDINEVINSYRLEKSNKGAGVKEVEAVVIACLLTHELIGSNDMSSINRDQVNNVIPLLKKYPKNAKSLHNKKHFSGLTAKEIISKNEGFGFPVRGRDATSTDIRRVSSLYRWAICHQFIDHNPFKGLTESKSKARRTLTSEGVKVAKDRKKPFDETDLKKIFSHSLYTQGKFSYSNKQRLNYQYWVPLIAYTTGARPNEICQLMVDDVSEREDILCFTIHEGDETQSLKSDSAARIIPVPNILLELGFEKYLRSVQSKKQLFPELTFTDKSGYYGKVERWFQRTFSQKMGLSAQSKSFYSFRHTFVHDFQRRGQRCPIITSLVGHANGNISDDTYGGRFDIPCLKGKIEKFQYSDVLKQVRPYEV